MNIAQNSLHRADHCFRKADHAQWHRQQSKLHILRSQLGFKEAPASRPRVCHGCDHYHGIAYGYSRHMRNVLVCGFHPYGWQGDHCPDWNQISS
jgi:hypothetical protein